MYSNKCNVLVLLQNLIDVTQLMEQLHILTDRFNVVKWAQV